MIFKLNITSIKVAAPAPALAPASILAPVPALAPAPVLAPVLATAPALAVALTPAHEAFPVSLIII